jgi:hypothetical protein
MALGERGPVERSGRGGVQALLLLGITGLAIALRFWRLGDWGFEATEIFTFRDSIVEPQLRNSRPLIYFLNYYVVQPLVPLDEFGLRLLPAIFGVLGIPALYFVARRLVGPRAALFGALLLTVSGLHVFYSQFARYWSLVFLLSTIYPYAIYLGIRERSRPALILGVLTGLLAASAHPSSVLLFGALGVWLAMQVRPAQLAHLWSQRSVRWGTIAVIILVGLLALRFVPMLQAWIAERDADPRGKGGEFLLHLPRGTGVTQASYLLSYVESVTLSLVLAGFGGIYVLWQGRDRPLALLLTCLATVPVGFMVLISFRTAVSTYYLLPAVPPLFIGAGVFLDRLAQVDWGVRPRWLLPATVTAMIMATGMPTLLSHYRDGRRYDFRGMASWLNQRIAPGDIIVSDQAMVFAHYLGGRTEVRRLYSDTVALAESVRALHRAGAGGALWIVAPAPSHAFRTSPKLGSLKEWTYTNCQLRNTTGVGRLDFRQHYLQIYRCPSNAAPDVGAKSE